MTTTSNMLWTVLTTNIPRRQWLNITELYKIVEFNFKIFTEEDLAPVTSYNSELAWHRNLRNALQRKKERGEILFDGNSSYRLDRPYVWQMIKDAVEAFNRQASYSEIIEYIKNHWADVNSATIRAQIIVLTVNHKSRIHYPENHKPRLSISNSPYDLLFTVGRGKVEKYSQNVHGIWEIFKDQHTHLGVRIFTEELSREIYTPLDIIWFKNVTSTTNGEAYLDLTENIFVLHFPTIHKTNVLTPKINELILIRQKVNGVPAFTHIVTPIDNDLIDENIRSDYRYGRRVKIIAKTDRENFIPVSSTLWSKVKSAGITQGNACKIINIKNIGNVDELQYDIWQKFTEYFVPTEQQSKRTTSAIIIEVETSDPDLIVSEGKLRLVAHMVKERNRKIIAEKKQQAIRNNTLHCEVCTFSFRERFNKDFIECHHKTPIGQAGIRETRLEDLELVCSNCHRMLHTRFDGNYLTIKQLNIRIT